MPKTVLITGGSSGVGAELVTVFIERGYAVWFTYNSGRSRADRLLESLPQGSSAKVPLPAWPPGSVTGLPLHARATKCIVISFTADPDLSMCYTCQSQHGLAVFT